MIPYVFLLNVRTIVHVLAIGGAIFFGKYLSLFLHFVSCQFKTQIGDVACCDVFCSYTTEAPEMQLRRLADLAMMFQLYELSYHTYHQCKRDFNNDHAWLHFAGATVRSPRSVSVQLLL